MLPIYNFILALQLDTMFSRQTTLTVAVFIFLTTTEVSCTFKKGVGNV